MTNLDDTRLCCRADCPGAGSCRPPRPTHRRAEEAPKIDQALSEALRRGAATQHVIITLKPGYRAEDAQAPPGPRRRDSVRDASIDALVVEIHSADVSELAERDEVAALSLDSDVYADGATAADNGRTGTTRRRRQPSTSTAPGPRDEHAARDARVAQSRELCDADRFDRHRRRRHRFRHHAQRQLHRRITASTISSRATGSPSRRYDDYGHGTHIAGLIGSSGDPVELRVPGHRAGRAA